jgi:hypothetical protein
MEMKRSLAAMHAAALAAGLALAAPALPADPVAIVTEVQGSAALDAGGRSRPLETLAQLPDGSRVRLESNARVVALFYRSGAQYVLAGPGEIAFAGSGPQPTAPASVTRRPAANGSKVVLQGSGLALGGVIARGAGMRPAAPVFTVMEPAPEFAWYDLRQGVGYRFALADASGTVLFETETTARSVQLPPNVRLEPGKPYRWRAATLGEESRAVEATFRVADADLLQRANALRPGPDAPFSDRVAYALWLEDVALRAEARRAWRELSAARPGDQALRSRASAVD